jgi:hypothetical protein
MNKYDEISKELYGYDYDSVNLTIIQRARVHIISEEREGHINVKRREQLNKRLI